jgi:Fe-S-cluster containining protein
MNGPTINHPDACMRCGNCCTRFGVCITPFDIKRISEAQGKPPASFVSLVLEPPQRERREPAIIIDGKRRLLVLKRDARDICCFYAASGCLSYESRPMLCRTYPFRLEGRKLVDMKSRACPMDWMPKREEKKAYLKDLMAYEKEIKAYAKLAKEWNRDGGGSLREFLAFALKTIGNG